MFFSGNTIFFFHRNLFRNFWHQKQIYQLLLEQTTVLDLNKKQKYFHNNNDQDQHVKNHDTDKPRGCTWGCGFSTKLSNS